MKSNVRWHTLAEIIAFVLLNDYRIRSVFNNRPTSLNFLRSELDDLEHICNSELFETYDYPVIELQRTDVISDMTHYLVVLKSLTDI